MTTTHSVADNALIDKLQWRYATKKMNPAKVVPQDKVDRIVEAARLAPHPAACSRLKCLW